MSWVDKIIAKAVERAIRGGVNEPLYQSIFKQIGAGNPVYIPDNVEKYISEGYLYNPQVYSIVSFIAQKASTIPWFVYNVKDKKALKLYKGGSPEMTIARKQLQKKAIEPIKDHELMRLFTTPNPLQGWAEFIEQTIGFKLVTGNSYIHAIGPDAGVNAGKIQEMWVLPSQAIEILAGDRMQPIKGYRYMIDKTTVIPPEEIIHLKYWTPEYISGSMLYGLSPIRAARRVVSKSNASYDAGTASFQNMGALGFISGNRQSNDMGLTEEQAQSIEDVLARKTGPKNRGKIMVTSADLKWQQIGMSPADLAIIESDKMDLRTLCNVYHVPSELFNDAANKTYSNTQEAGRAIWVNAVIPSLTQFRDAVNLFLEQRGQAEVYVDFDTSVVPELQDSMEALVAQLANAYWISPNEKRGLMGWDELPDEEADMLWIPAGLAPMQGWAEQEAAREQEAEANLAELNGGDEPNDEPSEEEVDEELKRLGINDYGTKGR